MPVAQRRQLAVHSSAGGLWGKGWFILPNPVYGTALKGGIDDVFPADKRWTDPGGQK
jgi:predicted secreted acid phosphatase